MRPYVIGCGHTGGMVADILLGYDKEIYYATAFNSHEADLRMLKRVKPKERVMIGRAYLEERGAGKELEVGKEIFPKYIGMMMDWIRAVYRKFRPDCFLLTSSAAGATGATISPLIAGELKTIKEMRDTPVYAALFLPSTRFMPEKDKILYLDNAAKTFYKLIEVADNTIPFDAEVFEKRISPEIEEKFYMRFDQEAATMLNTIFKAEEVARKIGSQEVAGTSEINETLKGGKVSTIGYSRKKLGGWIRKAKPEPEDLENVIIGTTKPGSLSFPSELKTAKRAMIITRGRSDHLYREAIESGKSYIEGMLEIGDVRIGLYEDPRVKGIAAVALYSGIDDLSRIEKMKRKGTG